MYNLSELIDNTYKSPSMKKMSTYWLLRFATIYDDRLASYLVARRYYEGTTIAKNNAQARYWAEKAKSLPQTERDRPFIGSGLDELLSALDGTPAAAAPIDYVFPMNAQKAASPAVGRTQQTAVTGADVPRENIPVFSERRKEYARDCERGMALYRANDFDAALPLVQTAANHGYPEAMYALSLMWLNGLGVPQKNERISLTWMQKAAYEGYAPAYQPLMYKYYNGVGTARDTEEARFWGQKALKQNPDPVIQKVIDACGGVPVINPNDLLEADSATKRKDYASAIRALLRLAYAGHPQACNNLSLFYNNGQGVERDPLQAFRWMREAAVRGYKGAYRPLLFKYLFGNGTAINLDAAQSWLQIMQEQKVLANPVDRSLLNALVNDHYRNVIFYQCCDEWQKNGHTVERFEWQYHMAIAEEVTAMKNLSTYYAEG